MDDLAAHLKGGAEETCGLLDLAGEHEPADVAGGDDLAVDLQQRRPRVCEKRSSSASIRGIALGAVAEAEVLADRDVRGAERADEHLVDELPRAALGEVGVEGNHDQLLHAQATPPAPP